MNKKIIEYYDNQISCYDKISFDEAKKLLASVVDADELVKKEMIDRVFKGTLHLVMRFIKAMKYEIFNSYTYDMNDVINSAFLLWYEKISNFEILRIPGITLAIGDTFASELARELIPCEDEYKNSLVQNRNLFNTMFEEYAYLKSQKDDVSFIDLLDYHNSQPNIGWHNCVSEYNLDARKNFEIIEKTYERLNISKDEKLNTRKIKLLSRLLEEQAMLDSISPNYVANCSLEDETVRNDVYRRLYDIMYNEIRLDDRSKDICELYFGLFDNDPHTFEEISKMRGMTSACAGQITNKVIKKVQKRLLKEYKWSEL